jgi:uncharacterized protein YjbI with pentapeptide repeats
VRTDLSHARAARASFAGADLTAADLSHADLAGAVLDFADLTRAMLLRTRLPGASARGTDWSNACLNGVEADPEGLGPARSGGAVVTV